MMVIGGWRLVEDGGSGRVRSIRQVSSLALWTDGGERTTVSGADTVAPSTINWRPSSTFVFADPTIQSLLRCPRCAGELEAARCRGCGTEFPLIDGVPWLFAEPAAALAEWRGRLELLLLELEVESARLRADLERPGLTALARNRLKLLAGAQQDHARRLRALLAPLGLGEPRTSHETHLALGTRLPATQGLSSYYVNVHRDWVWGGEENERNFALIARALGDLPPGRLLVLGAGAGRLVLDLHQNRSPELTVAVDINPLLMAVASKVASGQTLSLYEFPIAPRSIDEHALLRRLMAERPLPPGGVHWMLADASRPPFAGAAFDTVVTPWFVDILEEDFASFVRRLNALLRPGGRWINSGSLVFARDDSASRYSLEEVLELTRGAGFECRHLSEDRVPYMCSPASRHGRMETVVTFTAEKVSEVTAPAAHQSLPEWLHSGDVPVPQYDSFRICALSTRIHAFVMSLIDGRRTLRDIAALLVDQRLMTAEDAEPAVRGFLTRMYEDMRRRREL